VAEKYNWTIIDSAPNGNLLPIEDIGKLVWDEVMQILKL